MTSDPTPFMHEAVMVHEVVEVFRPVPSGVLVDATVGAGGHAEALLDSRGDVELIGLDRDGAALAAAASRLEHFTERVTLRRARFDELAGELADLGRSQVSGVLFDLGVSSPQLDVAERGFSYHQEGPLDMRMDRRDPATAAAVVNSYDEHRLAGLLRRYGDERYSRRIARAIVEARPIETTTQLAEVVLGAIPAAARRGGRNPARRTFQALRIEVNRELELLPVALDQALDALVPSGRCAVLSYHSGEDRLVKEHFRRAIGGGPRGADRPSRTFRGGPDPRAVPQVAPTECRRGCAQPTSQERPAPGGGEGGGRVVSTARASSLPARTPATREPLRRRSHLRVVEARPARVARRRITGLVLALTTLVLFASLFGLAVFHTVLVQSQSKLDHMDEQIVDSRSRTEQLRLRVAELEAPERLVDVAVEDLGMVTPHDVVVLTPAGTVASVPAQLLGEG